MDAIEVANGPDGWPEALPRDRESLEELDEVRGVLRRLFAASLAGAPFGAADLEAVNAWAASVPAYPQLGPDGELETATRRLSALAVARAAVARDAIELLGTEARERLAVCRAPGCGRYHLRTRPDRVWCSPACGNRARVARHHARRRA